MDVEAKLKQLRMILRDTCGVVLGFSGGVDSSLLAKVAREELGDKALAVIARSATYSQREYSEAVAFAKAIGIEVVTITSEELSMTSFAHNPVDRCYHCKKELFGKIWQVARARGIDKVADGTNIDDLADYRPGRQALQELAVISPFVEAQMTKADIRQISRALGMPTWDKPAFACMATRIPYGELITEEKLAMIEKAEDFLLDSGIRQVRVRYHGDQARIEVAPEERSKFFNEAFLDQVCQELQGIGFRYISLDLQGYRMGSMN